LLWGSTLPSVDDCPQTTPFTPPSGWLAWLAISGWFASESPAGFNRNQRLLCVGTRRQGYELVILDTAPHANQTALQAAKASDIILVPCRPSQFDLEAIAATLDLCDLAKKPATVVLNAAPIRSRVVDEAIEAVKGRGGALCPVIIRERVAFRHCIPSGNTAGEFEPGCSAAQEIRQLYNFVSECRSVNASTL
jgi:chromosome partitioning protein